MILKKIKKYLSDPLKYIVLIFLKLPFKNEHFNLLEIRSAKAQGKGYGSATIEREVQACLSLLNFRPKNFFDIGANKGKYTEEILSNFSDIECHLFEPSNVNYEILKGRYLNMDNVYINNFGLFDQETSKNFYSDYPGSGLGSLSKRKLDHHQIDLKLDGKINLKRFDEYWENFNSNKNENIDFVKIDVEGFEMQVLKGMGKYINNCKLIQFEFGTPAIDSRMFFQDFWYFFLELNFDLYRITPRNNLVTKISKYSEFDEFFITTNYIAVNNAN